jgi:hypothetical protein
LILILNPDGPGGKKTDTILVKTSSRTMPLLKISANTYLRERVYTFPDEVDLGALRLRYRAARSAPEDCAILMVYHGRSDL